MPLPLDPVIPERAQEQASSIQEAEATIRLLRQQLADREESHQADITQLRESREQWRSLVENAPDVILHVRRDGQIVFINHMRDRPDLTLDQMIGRSVLGFVDPEYHHVALQFLEQVFDRRVSADAEVLAEGPFGTKKWYACHASPIWSGETFEKVTVVCRDVTEARNVRERLIEMDQERIRLCRAAVAGTVAAGLAHQLNQPLTVLSSLMLGSKQRLASQTLTADDIAFVIENLEPELKKMMDLVRGWQQFIRREEPRADAIEIESIVEGAVALATPLAELSRVTIRSMFAAPGKRVLLESVLVQQAVLNIIINGVEAVRDLDAPRREVVISTRAEDSRLEICIRDQGKGFDEARLQDAFVPFVTTKPAGLGMGLSISHGIAESHRGCLKISNHPEGGAQVVFEFPIAD